MNKYYTKFFLLNLIIFSVMTSHFINCELNDSARVTNLKKDEKTICRNKSSKGKPSFKQFLLTPAGFGILMFALFVGTNRINEWIEGRRLSFIERELEMINLSLTCLVAIALFGGSGCCSPIDKKVEEVQEALIEPICASRV